MAPLRPSTDVLPVTEFRANTSSMLTRLQATRRPVVLTQHGRGAAVVMDVSVYEDMLDEIAILRDIRVAEEQIARGEGVPHEEALARLRAKLVK
jgi:antitoxin YefM